MTTSVQPPTSARSTRTGARAAKPAVYASATKWAWWSVVGFFFFLHTTYVLAGVCRQHQCSSFLSFFFSLKKIINHRCTTWAVWLSRLSPPPCRAGQRWLSQTCRGQRSRPETPTCVASSLVFTFGPQGVGGKQVFGFFPWAAGAVHLGGGAATDLPEAANEETVHREHRDDVTHTARRQGASAHDQLGQEDPRSVSVKITECMH